MNPSNSRAPSARLREAKIDDSDDSVVVFTSGSFSSFVILSKHLLVPSSALREDQYSNCFKNFVEIFLGLDGHLKYIAPLGSRKDDDTLRTNVDLPNLFLPKTTVYCLDTSGRRLFRISSSIFARLILAKSFIKQVKTFSNFERENNIFHYNQFSLTLEFQTKFYGSQLALCNITNNPAIFENAILHLLVSAYYCQYIRSKLSYS
jgi:hypothetical protein